MSDAMTEQVLRLLTDLGEPDDAELLIAQIIVRGRCVGALADFPDITGFVALAAESLPCQLIVHVRNSHGVERRIDLALSHLD